MSEQQYTGPTTAEDEQRTADEIAQQEQGEEQGTEDADQTVEQPDGSDLDDDSAQGDDQTGNEPV